MYTQGINMYTKLAELFTRSTVDISDIKREADTLLFNALFSPRSGANTTALDWLNFVDAVQTYAKKHDATVLVHDSHIEDYLQKDAYNSAMKCPGDVRAFVDIDAIICFNRDAAYLKFLDYPTPVGSNTKGIWYFI